MNEDVAPLTGLDRAVRDSRCVLTRLLADGGFERLSDDDLLGAVRAVEALGRAVDAARAAGAVEVKERCRPERADGRIDVRVGARSAHDLLTRITGASSRTVSARIRAGRRLRVPRSLAGDSLAGRLPLVRAACETGLLSEDAADAIHGAFAPRIAGMSMGEAAERAVVSQALGIPAAEGEIPDLTADDIRALADSENSDGSSSFTGFPERMVLPADTVKQIARVWAEAIDPDGTMPKDADTASRRGLALSPTREGLVRINGLLLPEVGAGLHTLLSALTNPKTSEAQVPDPTDTDRASGVDALGVAADGGVVDVSGTDRDRRVGRSRAMLVHDAFASLVSKAAALPSMPQLAGAAPTLVVTMTAQDVADPKGVAHLADVPAGAFQAEASTIPARVALHAACDGVVERVRMDERGRILQIESRARVFTGRQRRAIAARDGGCVIPGCTVGPAWCEVHHVREYAAGGRTTTDNGVLLCWYHHRFLDALTWRIRMREGVPEVKAPVFLGGDGQWRPAQSSATRRLFDARSAMTKFEDGMLEHRRRTAPRARPRAMVRESPRPEPPSPEGPVPEIPTSNFPPKEIPSPEALTPSAALTRSEALTSPPPDISTEAPRRTGGRGSLGIESERILEGESGAGSGPLSGRADADAPRDDECWPMLHRFAVPDEARRHGFGALIEIDTALDPRFPHRVRAVEERDVREALARIRPQGRRERLRRNRVRMRADE